MSEFNGGSYYVEKIGVENMPDKITHSIIKYRNDTYSQSLRLIPDYRCIHKQDQNKSFNAELKTKKHPTFHDVYLEVDQLINNYVDMQYKFAPCLYCYWDVSLDVEIGFWVDNRFMQFIKDNASKCIIYIPNRQDMDRRRFLDVYLKCERVFGDSIIIDTDPGFFIRAGSGDPYISIPFKLIMADRPPWQSLVRALPKFHIA